MPFALYDNFANPKQCHIIRQINSDLLVCQIEHSRFFIISIGVGPLGPTTTPLRFRHREKDEVVLGYARLG